MSFTIILRESESWTNLSNQSVDSNLTSYETTTLHIISEGLSALVPGLNKENVTLTG